MSYSADTASLLNPHDLNTLVSEFLDENDPESMSRLDFLRARFDEGLAWVAFPRGRGGLGLPSAAQAIVDALFDAAGAPDNDRRSNTIGLGMVAPTILQFGTEDQKDRFLRPLWTGEEVWCQLFSEPGAGSDLASVATRAASGSDGWVVSGQKVWTSRAHSANFGILLARTDPALPKHRGLSFFLCDMSDPGIEVRPLRQLTGEAEFNEVFLTDVHIPADYQIGGEGDGWKIALSTLGNERIAIGGKAAAREDGMVGVVSEAWRRRPELRRPDLHDRLVRLWAEAEVARLVGVRLKQKATAGQPGPEGAAMKLSFARVNQELSGLELEFLASEGLTYQDWTMVRPEKVDMLGNGPGYRYLRAKGNSIEGGTSEILRNIVAERVLGLPGEMRTDKDKPWREGNR